MSIDDKVIFRIDGVEYRFLSGFGSQLYSREKYLPLGTVRHIGDRLFYVFSSYRKSWFKYEIAWGMVGDDDLDTKQTQITSFKKYLEKMI